MDFQSIIEPIVSSLPQLLGALAILIIGLFIANFIANKVGKMIEKNEKVKSFFTQMTGGKGNVTKAIQLLVKLVFYVFVIFVIGLVFDALNLTLMTDPLNRLLAPIFAFVPKLFAAAIVFIISWIVATVVKMIIEKSGQSFGLNEKVNDGTEQENVNLTSALAEIAFWVVLFFFLPLVLSILELNGILTPLQNMIDKVLNALPNIISAGVIFVVGWFVASKIKDAVASLLRSVGVDKLTMHDANDTLKVSEILSLLVYVLILIPVIAAGLEVIGLASLAQPVSNMIQSILAYVPTLFSAGVIVFLAYFLGRIVSDIVTGVVAKFNLEKGFRQFGLMSETSTLNVAKIVGNLVYFFIVFFAALQAAELLGFTQLTILANDFIVLFGQILLGLVVIALGVYAAQFVSDLIKRQNTQSSDMLAMIAKVSIIVLSLAMGIRQMGIGDTIIDMAFGFTLGAIALAVAIAFGVGGRDTAARILEKFRKDNDQL